MQKESEPHSTSLVDSDEPEAVLVEAQPPIEDDEILIHKDEAAEAPEDINYAEEDEEEFKEAEEPFEDDEEEMHPGRIGLHDISTLRNLYRFGLLNTQKSRHRYSIGG
jgi:hypothetical protein